MYESCKAKLNIVQIALENFFSKEKLGVENRFEVFFEFMKSRESTRKKVAMALTDVPNLLPELCLMDMFKHSLEEQNSTITMVIRQIVDVYS